MASKSKRIFDKEKSEQKKAFRIPTAKKTQWHKDYTKYSRKEKHKKPLCVMY